MRQILGFTTGNGAHRFFLELHRHDDWRPGGGVSTGLLTGVLKERDSDQDAPGSVNNWTN
jgi:hypothetical protein